MDGGGGSEGPAQGGPGWVVGYVPDPEEERRRLVEAQRDPEKFDWFCRRYYLPIHGFLSRRTGDAELAKDLTAETFLRAHAALGGFRWSGHPLRPWLYTIAVNALRAHYRAQGRRGRGVELDEAAQLSDGDPGALEALLAREDRTRVRAAVEALPDLYRDLIHLHHLEEIDVATVAEILGMPEGTVKAYLWRGRAWMARYLAGGSGREAGVRDESREQETPPRPGKRGWRANAETA